MEKAQKFGRWTVVGEAAPLYYERKGGGKPHIMKRVDCVCDCGTQRIVPATSIKNGYSTSCGCFNRECSSLKNTQHGCARGNRTPEYNAWITMKARCFNQRNSRFNHYGGRGITVCARWMTFEDFLKDMGLRPSDKHSLDRKDNDGNYDPSNCRWTTSHIQMTNRSVTRFVDFNGETVPLATLAKTYKIPANTLRHRVLSGMSVKDALSTPVREKRKNGTGSKRAPIIPAYLEK